MNNAKKKLMLLSGCPRSGTTLINFILNSHPKVAITNEIDLVKMHHELSEIIFSKNVKYNLNKITRKKSDAETLDLDNVTKFRPQNNQLIPEVIKLFCSSINDSADLQIYGDKTPTYYLYDIENLIKLSSNKTIYILHITRNPISVVESIRRRTINSLKGKDYWRALVTTRDALIHWTKAWNARKILRSHKAIKFLDLNYDAFIMNPDKGYEVIGNFLEIENTFDKNIINKNINKNNTKSSPRNIFKGHNRIEYYSSIWSEMPLDLSEYNEKISLLNDSFWNKIQRKILRTFITIRRK